MYWKAAINTVSCAVHAAVARINFLDFQFLDFQDDQKMGIYCSSFLTKSSGAPVDFCRLPSREPGDRREPAARDLLRKHRPVPSPASRCLLRLRFDGVDLIRLNAESNLMEAFLRSLA